MQQSTDPRHIAREIALAYLYQQLISDKNELETQRSSVDAVALQLGFTEDEYDAKLLSAITDDIEKHFAETDEIIKQYAPKRPIDQISLLDLLIMRIAIYEGFILKITPPRVAINEAIELAKHYGNENSAAFVNGVLGSFYDTQKDAPKDDSDKD